MPSRTPTATLLLLALAAAPAAVATPAMRYQLSLDDGAAQLSVRACPLVPSIRRLELDGQRTARLSDLRSTGAGPERPLQLRRDGLAPPAGDACIEYRVDLTTVDQTRGRRGRFTVTDPRGWLLAPRDRELREALVELELPDGMAASVPWTELDAGRYRIAASPQARPALVAFGELRRDRFEVGGTRFELALVGEGLDRERIRDWLRAAAIAVDSVDGGLDVPSVQLLVLQTPRRDEPVPWGMVLRGGGPAVMLQVAPDATARELSDDWTATHEFSHLLMPYVRADDTWLREGMAAYYQYVARARAGQYDEREAWEGIMRGFDRGRGDLTGRTLAEDSRRRRGAYRRLHWSGAAIVLMADAALRADGHAGMDQILSAIRPDFPPDGVRYGADELLAAMDGAAGRPVLVPLSERWLGSRSFPELRPLLAELGIRWDGEQLSLDEDAPLAAVRRAIMAPVGSD